MELDNNWHGQADEFDNESSSALPQEPQPVAKVDIGYGLDEEDEGADLSPPPAYPTGASPMPEDALPDSSDTAVMQRAEKVAQGGGQAVMSTEILVESAELQGDQGRQLEAALPKEAVQPAGNDEPEVLLLPDSGAAASESTGTSDDASTTLSDGNGVTHLLPQEQADRLPEGDTLDIPELTGLIQHSMAGGDTAAVKIHPIYIYGPLAEELPEYARAARTADMSAEQASELLAHAIAQVGPDDIPEASPIVAVLLGRTLEASALSGGPMTDEHLADLKSLLVDAGHKGAIRLTLNSYEAGCRAGLSPEASAELVNGYLDSGNIPDMVTFREALRALDSAGVEPTVTQEVFELVQKMDPSVRRSVYRSLARDLSHGAQMPYMTPQDFMSAVNTNLKGGEANPLPTAETILAKGRLERDDYFREAEGPLRHQATPYRTEHSWQQGVKDIAGLVGAQSARGDIVSEGFWIYDPEQNRWYSQGGRSYASGSGLYHAFLRYDVSN
jgi:hypothetical protein